MDSFSFDTIENFDNHINLSIPGYSSLLAHVVRISSYFLRSGSTMYDFGCSTGNLINTLKKQNPFTATYIGVDKSENMVKENDFIISADLIGFTPEKHSLSTLIFTLQFIEPKYRLNILRAVFNSLEPGGALIVSEKVFIPNGFLQDVFSFTYYDFKLEHFSAEDILKKQKDLRYIMRPLTEAQNIKLFRDAGFTIIEQFWQSLQFKSWILLK